MTLFPQLYRLHGTLDQSSVLHRRGARHQHSNGRSSGRIYLLCDETRVSADMPSETRSIVYVVDFSDKTFYPVAHVENKVSMSATKDEISWLHEVHKLSDDGRFHRLNETGQLNRKTGMGEKTITDDGPGGAKTATFSMKCISGSGTF